MRLRLIVNLHELLLLQFKVVMVELLPDKAIGCEQGASHFFATLIRMYWLHQIVQVSCNAFFGFQLYLLTRAYDSSDTSFFIGKGIEFMCLCFRLIFNDSF